MRPPPTIEMLPRALPDGGIGTVTVPDVTVWLP
jgi:hypothetical protein